MKRCIMKSAFFFILCILLFVAEFFTSGLRHAR
jgi:hypothetical protein